MQEVYTDEGRCTICGCDVMFGKLSGLHDKKCGLGKIVRSYEAGIVRLQEEIKNTPRTSTRLETILNSENTADAAIRVYAEALAEEGSLKDLKSIALVVAKMDMEEGGESHHRNPMGGTAGWTKPKRKRLNVEKWNSLEKPKEVEDLMQRIRDANSLATDLSEKLNIIQQEQDCFELPEPSFYIKK